MHNLTELTGNATSHTSLSVIIKMCVVIPFFCIFLCCIVIMLRIFATNRHFLDSSRYILFAYMLINDTLQLLSSVILFLLVVCLVKFPTVYCVPLLLLSTSTFMNTNLILATMSLERYVAIIYPLQRPAAWRSDRIWIIILSIWFLSFNFPMIEYSIGERDSAVDILSTPVLCKPIYINSSPIRGLFRAAVNILFFAVVSVVSIMAPHVSWSPGDITFFYYFCFILIPRFLSPLIYGFRDQALRDRFGKTFLCCSNKANPV
ncbi:hypothetical protein CesoFtcFv8_006447 [Champsocephalus esox]|uniref:G-protein coupled receptors family 1 profile domain-containing protein n=1 Tax=Champsocephalus esox TaxID=159716 RepID=A0AAN8CJB9_9TELE|nr:hypothetical protein CesoFtcFv8_006447 [Champsocephalus esox]